MVARCYRHLGTVARVLWWFYMVARVLLGVCEYLPACCGWLYMVARVVLGV